MRDDVVVESAIERWTQTGLIGEDLAKRLRNEIVETAAGRSRRTAQYIIAITAGLVLLTASGLFISKSWPLLPTPVRTFILGGAGFALIAVGTAMEPRFRVRPVSYLLQASGLLMLLFAYAHSDQTWPKGTFGGIVAGMLALATPIISTVLSVRRNPIMPAVNAAVAYAFIAFFLDRIGVPEDAIVWILDGVLLVALAALVVRLRSAGPDTPNVATSLYAFVASMVTGLVLAGLTAAGPLSAGGGTVYALDLWLLIITGTALWANHRAPAWLKRPWYDDILAVCVVLAAVFAFLTLDELGVDSDWLGFGSALIGSVALLYGVRTGGQPVLLAGACAVVISVWHFGISQAGSLGAVGALVVTAALLFWVASQLGKTLDEE